MNILGQPFKPWVTDQINIRQSVLGKQHRNIQDLQYYNSKTPWIRLVSSIDVTSEALNNVGEITTNNPNTVLKRLERLTGNAELVTGDALAKNLTLFGGVLGSDSERLKFGLNKTNNIFQKVYGFGGIEEKGLVPMPGITNVAVQYYNNGALSKTLIDIKCYNRIQLMLLDVLYLRVGYTLLLEFGHSIYLDNNGDLITDQEFNTGPYNMILNPSNQNQYDMWDSIETEREARRGNYEGVFGKVTNFNWTFNPDGSYDVQVHLTSMGEVLESLKLNIPSTPSSNTSNTLQSNSNSSVLHRKLVDIFETSEFHDPNNPKSSDYKIYNFSTPSSNFKETKTLNIENGIFSIPQPKCNTISTNYSDTHLVYINFGLFIALIQQYIIPYNKECPLFCFDMDFENLSQDKNYIFKFPGQFSSDPTKCIVPWENVCDIFQGYLSLNTDDIIELPINKVLNQNGNHFKGTYLRRLSQIYINATYILNILDTISKDDEGNIKALDVIQKILKDIGQCLGGINSIRVIQSQDKIKFIEEIPQRFDSPEETGDGKLALINLYGVKNQKGSFVKNISLNSQLSNEFSYLTSISAQVTNNQLGVNPMGFSNYSLGLKDRMVEERIVNKKQCSQTQLENPIRQIENLFNTKINNTESNSLFKVIYDQKNLEECNLQSLFNHNLEYSKSMIKELNQMRQIASPAFIPFQLSIKMDGLSGMVLYQKFDMDQQVLPLHYDSNNIDNQIKSINHIVSKEGWETELETISVPNYDELDPIGETKYIEGIRYIEDLQTCGEPFLVDKYPLTNPTSNVAFDIQSINNSRNNIFNKFGSSKIYCAKYVYNIVNDWLLAYQNLPVPNRTQLLKSQGNAKDDSFISILTSLGYKRHAIAKNIQTPGEIQSIINNIPYDIGDVLIYWGNKGNSSENAIQYGHAQVYLGNGRWESSIDYNWGNRNFVYNSKTGISCWNLLLLRINLNILNNPMI